MKHFLLILGALLALFSCGQTPQSPHAPKAMVLMVKVDGVAVPNDGSLGDVSLTPRICLEFSREIALDKLSLASLAYSGGELTARVTDGTVLELTPAEPLAPSTRYRLGIAAGESFGIDLMEGFVFSFTTAYDPSDKFPRISDDELLTKVQEQTFAYFWDYAHPGSGMARERLGSGNTVTSGGSGFGIMCLPVGVERGFVSREAAAERMRKILRFLATADRFHGVYPHWMNGDTGKVIPFSSKDNGGDLVETAFLMQGLLSVQSYFDKPEEADIRAAIDLLWREVEWEWYTRGGQKVLYWHWSPSDGWAMNMKITGWNEALIVYVLAAASPTHPVPADVYHEGWAQSRRLKPSVGGPLFFAHYSFLGLDPRGLSDAYCGDYFAHNVAHARYNYEYCVRNPGHHAGYSAASWGLTASDIPGGYTASSPSNDKGVIAPTAAVASLPYVREESMEAIRTFYYIYGDRLWGEYGFRDAFSLDNNWFASSYIAIDQGPIVVMIENARTGLLWQLFMQNEDVLRGLSALGFSRQ